MFKQSQKIAPQNVQAHPNNCLTVFDHFVGLAFEGLIAKSC